MPAKKKEEVLTYKGKLLLRKGNEIYYGSPNEKYMVVFRIKESEKLEDLEISKKVVIELRTNDETNSTLIKQAERDGLYKAFDEEGIEYEKTGVGDRFVYENMVQNGYCVGGEQSGHIILSKYATTGDGILTSIELMEAMLDSKQTLSRLCAPVKTYPQVLKNVRVSDKKAVRENAAVKAAVEAAAKSLEGSGRVLLRESGTEPVIRVMAEALELRDAEMAVNSMIDAMKAEGLA